jgi:hypothetical protein
MMIREGDHSRFRVALCLHEALYLSETDRVLALHPIRCLKVFLLHL